MSTFIYTNNLTNTCLKIRGGVYRKDILILYNIPKSGRKRIVPLIECELSFLTGNFLNTYDIIDRKLKLFVTYSTVGKREKWEENTIVETTIFWGFWGIYSSQFCSFYQLKPNFFIFPLRKGAMFRCFTGFEACCKQVLCVHMPL